jgi:dTDP-4-dehydrorhamnose reductase
MENIIIFGKNGQVASDLLKIFSKKKQFKIKNYSSKDINFSNLAAVKKFLPKLPEADLIINATAYNEVDKAEDEKELAENINHKTVALIAKYCKKNDVKLIHYSTNYVFDGKGKSPYKEDNINNLKPLGIYGKSKLNGEKAIIKSECDYLILRVATVYNLGFENNFIAKIRNLAHKNKELKIVNDQICNPINSYDIAENTIKIIEKLSKKPKFKQIYHLVSKKAISYYDFAKKITSDINYLKITPVTTDHFPTKAKRPLNGALNSNKLKRNFNIEIQNNYKDVTIILVAYNSAHIIGNALKNTVGRGYRIVIIDNGSNDNLEQYLEDHFKGSGIKLISLANNIGFGRANNLALEDVNTNYAFLLNPDAIITEKSIDNLVKEAEKDERIALSGALEIKKEKVNQSDIEQAIENYKQNRQTISETQNYLETDFLCGGYLLLRISIFKKIGFFDKNFFLYGEDEEICDRVIKGGYKNILVKDSIVYHDDHNSTKTIGLVAKYKLLYKRYFYMGWSRTYLKQTRIKKFQIWLHLIRQFLSSFLYLPLFKLDKFIERIARAIGGLYNIFDIDCFNKKNRDPKIKSQNII